MKSAKVMSVNVSAQKGTRKRPVAQITIDGRGIAGDAHAGNWHRQVSLLSREAIDAFQVEMGRPIENGEFAENITTQGLDLATLSILDRVVIGAAELEVTQIGKSCHGDKCAIFREAGKCVMPAEGIFCRVVRGGEVKPGMPVAHHPRPFNILVITASDRASRGEYEDLSGPEVKAAFTTFFKGTRWHPRIQARVLADDGAALRGALESFAEAGGNVVVITGGTGIGPRDVTPEVVTAFCDRLIPGIMEFVRTRYGADKTNALLSRSVAGVKGRMLVYAIPGSPRAAREYMDEILKTMEHAVLMLHGLDAH